MELLLTSLLAAWALTTLLAKGHCDRQVQTDVFLYGGDDVGLPLRVVTGNNGWHLNPTNRLQLFSNQIFKVPQGCGEFIQMSAKLQYETLIAITVPLTSPLGFAQDPVYGYGTFGLHDFTGYQFEIWLTNTKVYALYARLQTTQTIRNFYRSFIFLVPIADREIPNVDVYDIVLEAEAKSVSYRMNGFELLRIKPVGTSAVDSKFQLADYGGYWDLTDSFPETVFAVIGGGFASSIVTGLPHTVCQRALFSQCRDNIFDAEKTDCQYSPLPVQTSGFIAQPVLEAHLFSVSLVRNLETCPEWTCNPDAKRMNVFGHPK